MVLSMDGDIIKLDEKSEQWVSQTNMIYIKEEAPKSFEANLFNQVENKSLDQEGKTMLIKCEATEEEIVKEEPNYFSDCNSEGVEEEISANINCTAFNVSSSTSALSESYIKNPSPSVENIPSTTKDTKFQPLFCKRKLTFQEVHTFHIEPPDVAIQSDEDSADDGSGLIDK